MTLIFIYSLFDTNYGLVLFNLATAPILKDKTQTSRLVANDNLNIYKFLWYFLSQLSWVCLSFFFFDYIHDIIHVRNITFTWELVPLHLVLFTLRWVLRLYSAADSKAKRCSYSIADSIWLQLHNFCFGSCYSCKEHSYDTSWIEELRTGAMWVSHVLQNTFLSWNQKGYTYSFIEQGLTDQIACQQIMNICE